MAITVALSAGAKEALANKAAGGTNKFEFKYVVFVDAASSPVRFVADATAVTVNTTYTYKNDITATGTCPAAVTTPIGGQAAPSDSSTANTAMLVIGDVGAYSIANRDEAVAIVAAGWTTLTNYVMATVTATGADQKAVTAGQVFSLTLFQLTW